MKIAIWLVLTLGTLSGPVGEPLSNLFYSPVKVPYLKSEIPPTNGNYDNPTDARVSESGRTGTASSNDKAKANHVGRIIKKRHQYVLVSADGEYLLDDHGEAKKYKSKFVKVTGNADDNHVIRVEAIKLSSPER